MTGFREMVSEDVHGEVSVAYNDVLTQAFHVAVGLACIDAVGVMWSPWESTSTKGRRCRQMSRDAVAAFCVFKAI